MLRIRLRSHSNRMVRWSIGAINDDSWGRRRRCKNIQTRRYIGLSGLDACWYPTKSTVHSLRIIGWWSALPRTKHLILSSKMINIRRVCAVGSQSIATQASPKLFWGRHRVNGNAFSISNADGIIQKFGLSGCMHKWFGGARREWAPELVWGSLCEKRMYGADCVMEPWAWGKDVCLCQPQPQQNPGWTPFSFSIHSDTVYSWDKFKYVAWEYIWFSLWGQTAILDW